MPKRSCPFGEAAPLQLKTRVGLRELSRGVRGEEFRREVFALSVLMPACVFCEVLPPVAASGDSAALGASRCFLFLAIKYITSLSCLFQAVPPGEASRACSSCVRTTDVKEVCTQCDRFVCQNCSRLCSCCNTVTCSLCSTIDYADVGEQVLCNGCSIFQV
ncbi:SIVA protein, partial [Sclerurus mexicanus]|nr:SIVA protein [Sclerurus mexicanus]